MFPVRIQPAEFQVHYLGSSADLGALRRSLEARGVVSRSRLTPVVTAVVADTTVPADHPTLVAARELGIEVFGPAQAIDRLFSSPALRTMRSMRSIRATPLPVASTPLIALTVLVMIGLLALLGVSGLFGEDDRSSRTTVHQVSDHR